MTETRPEIDPDRRARRNARLLALAQAVLGSQLTAYFILGGLAGMVLAPNPCLATLPVSVMVFASMATAPVLAGVMQRQGRRPGFVFGALAGALGGALCTLGLLYGSFALFLAGSAAAGVFMCSYGFYRFAAADGASEAFRPRAISWVMAAGLVAALVGPQIVKLAQDLLAPIPFAGAYVAVTALNLIGAPLFFFLDSPALPAPAPGSDLGRSRLDLIRDPRIAVAVTVAAVSYSIMNLVMTATPLAMVGCGYATADAANVVGAHVIAMFGPAFLTGPLIARFGAERIMAVGLTLLAGAGVAALSGVALSDFFLALVLLGVGWNFGFIGATALLTSAYRPQERGRAQGMNDFIVFGAVGLASLASGGLLNCSGGDPVAGWRAVNLAMIPLLALAFGALIWLVLGRARPAAR